MLELLVLLVRSRQVQLIDREIAGEVVTNEDDPGFLSLVPGIKELQLRVGHAAICRVDNGWLSPVSRPHELNKPFAVIDLAAEPLAKLPISGGEIILRYRLITQRLNGSSHCLTRSAQFATDGGKKESDKRILRLIGILLRSGIMANGLVTPSTEGAVQGSPLSPLLSNIVLDELDKELERRDLEFCRFADDCNIFVKTPKAAEGTVVV